MLAAMKQPSCDKNDWVKSVLYAIQNGDHRPLVQSNCIPTDVMECYDLIKNKFQQVITVEELAQSCHMSTSAFIRKFQRYFSETPYAFLQIIRLKHSATLLQTTTCTIEEIAIACGFTEQNNFTKQFVKKYGITPTQYRKNVVKNLS